MNGQVHLIIPGRLLIFGAPREGLIGNVQDTNGRRHFSPTFYASLLRHLGVSTVLQLDNADYDPAAFAREGILHLRHPRADSTCVTGGVDSELELVDSFLALCDRTRAGGGVLALHAEGRLGYAATLIAAFIHRDHRRIISTHGEALAWVSMARGAPIALESDLIERIYSASKEKEEALRASLGVAGLGLGPIKPQSGSGSPRRGSERVRRLSDPHVHVPARGGRPAELDMSASPPEAHPAPSPTRYVGLGTWRRKMSDGYLSYSPPMAGGALGNDASAPPERASAAWGRVGPHVSGGALPAPNSDWSTLKKAGNRAPQVSPERSVGVSTGRRHHNPHSDTGRNAGPEATPAARPQGDSNALDCRISRWQGELHGGAEAAEAAWKELSWWGPPWGPGRGCGWGLAAALVCLIWVVACWLSPARRPN